MERYSMKTILITGGAGSVGKELTFKLVAQGHRVRVFDLPICDYSELEHQAGIEIFKGDIRDPGLVQDAVRGTDIVLHLAAILPPASERDRARTFGVNVEGTQRVVEAIQQTGGTSRLIFASSVATYGDTTASTPPIRVDHPQRPIDIYGESKVAAEQVILQAGIPYTILRISGIVIPALMDPPDPYPFTAQQRIELVCRADVVTALLAAVDNDAAAGKILNIAGGPSWQMYGHEYVEKVFPILDIPIEDAHYREEPGWSDWYDTAESQTLLAYQNTPFELYLEQLEKAVLEALG
jgi:nucleoside-diphosphate-sugar epimerase